MQFMPYGQLNEVQLKRFQIKYLKCLNANFEGLI